MHRHSVFSIFFCYPVFRETTSPGIEHRCQRSIHRQPVRCKRTQFPELRRKSDNPAADAIKLFFDVTADFRRRIVCVNVAILCPDYTNPACLSNGRAHIDRVWVKRTLDCQLICDNICPSFFSMWKP